MNIKTLYLMLTISFIGMANATEKNSFISPYIGINNAINKAKEYVTSNNINVANKSITSAVYNSDLKNKYNRPYWSVYWSVTIYNKNTAVKGGTYEVKIYSDGTVTGIGYK